MTTLEHDDPPLVEIERRVQERAKTIALDMGRPDGGRELRALIDDEITRWQGDYKRGLRPYDLPNPDVVSERAYRNLAGYGPLTPLLDDPDVWEIMINSPSGLFSESRYRINVRRPLRPPTTTPWCEVLRRGCPDRISLPQPHDSPADPGENDSARWVPPP